MKETDKVSQKWGFGMAPISKGMKARYDIAVEINLQYLEGKLRIQQLSLEHISELKGMFNRCVLQDQWDWFSVYTEMGRPPFKNMRKIVFSLKELRTALKESKFDASDIEREKLVESNILHYLHTYQKDSDSKCLGLNEGWIYILSIKEYPQLLKIGMTTRPVETRIKEINSATGLAFPYSTKKVIRVSNPQEVEKKIHVVLNEYRVRSDREFFKIEFDAAIHIIDSLIKEFNFRERQIGIVDWFDKTKEIGTIDAGFNSAVFLDKIHVVNKKQINFIQPGVKVEFDIGRNLRGLIALNVKIVQ